MLAGVGVLGESGWREGAPQVTGWHLVRRGQAWKGLHSHLGALCWARARRQTSGTGKLQLGTREPERAGTGALQAQEGNWLLPSPARKSTLNLRLWSLQPPLQLPF